MTKSHAHVVFTIRGDDLDPDQVSVRLGVQPNQVARKGEFLRSARSARAKVGSWGIDRRVDDLDELDATLRSTVLQVTANRDEWVRVAAEFDTEVTLVFYLYNANEGTGLTSETLRELAERRLELHFDLYSLADTSEQQTK